MEVFEGEGEYREVVAGRCPDCRERDENFDLGLAQRQKDKA